MPFTFIKFIKNLHPSYFWVTDTYKDPDGRNGFWERYLGIYEQDLDTEVYPFIRDILDILDSQITPEDYLIYLSYMMGDVPNVGNPVTQRKLLKWIVRLWQKKGTKVGFEMLFRFFGLGVTVLGTCGDKPVRYDNEPIDLYDDEDNFYDMDCSGCADIGLAYWFLDNPCITPDNPPEPLPPAILDTLNKLVCLLMPIDVRFTGFVPRYGVCDDLVFEITEGDDFNDPNACAVIDPTTITVTSTYSGCTYATNSFQATSTVIGEALLSWDLSGGPGILAFEIEGTGTGQNSWKSLTTALPNQTTFNVVGLTPNISYDFRLRIRKADGHCYWQYTTVQILDAVCSIPTNIQIHNTI